jgi:uncharacterized protein (TIGR03437 family)
VAFLLACTGEKALLAAPATASGTLAPSAGSPFTVGAGPESIATGDFNGDGNPDLVTANSAANSVTVLLGDGSGGFAAAPGSPFAVGANPQAVAVGDFNRDGNLDIASANAADNTVTVLLGNGSGGFSAALGSPVAVGAGPESLAVADFNGDGNPDIATANLNGSNVTVLLGNGLGGFATAPGNPFTVGTGPHSIATGDFNGDEVPDLVTANSGSNTMTIILGNGSGGFSAPQNFTAPASPHSVAVADFNLDGNLDAVTADSGGTTVTVLLGDGLGGLHPGTQFTVGSTPDAVGVGDFNGDGNPDIAVANEGNNTLSILLGNGLGGFARAGGSPFPVGSFPASIVVADLNGDGRLDIAAANAGGNSATVLLGEPASTSSALTTTAGATVGYGTAVPLTLTVTQPAGGFTVPSGTGTFLDAGISLGNGAQTGSPYTFNAIGLAPGIHPLTASYAGDAGHASSTSNTLSLTVTQTSQTITFGAISGRAFGSAPFTVAASASSGLAVGFSSATAAVCTVSAATVTLLSGGSCTIQAAQTGNANYAAATPVNQSFTVTPIAQTITFGPLANQAFGAAPFALTASASSALIVSFTASPAAVCTVSGATVTLVSGGTCTIQAAQAGNSDYTAATAVSQHFSVSPGSQTITFGALAAQVFGTASFTVTATASSSLAVSFTSTTSSVCTVTGATVKLISVGTCTIKAAQAGNSTYGAATAVSQSFSVTQGNQTVTFAALMDQVLGTTPFTVTATASSGLAVSFASTTLTVCTVAVATVTLVSVGACTIQATQAGNANYASATPVGQLFNVTQANQTITFAALSKRTFGTAPFTVTATASSGLAVSFASPTQGVCTVSQASVTLVSAGSCTIQASQPGNNNYAAAAAISQSFTVAPASQTITFGAIPNQTLGTAPFTVTATASSGLAVSFASTTSSVCTVTGATVTLVIAGTCTIQATQAGNTNYAAASPLSQNFTVGGSALGTVNIASVLNAGSYYSAPIAPGSWVTLFGNNFSTATAKATSSTLPTTLAGAAVAITDSKGASQPAQLDFVSPTQINLLVPKGLAVGAGSVTITNVSANQGSAATTIATVSPSLFTADSSGTGAPAAIALAFTSGTSTPQNLPVFTCSTAPVVCAPAPIDLGPATTSVYLELFGSGIRGRSGLSGVVVTLGGTALQVTYAGAQATFAGLDQVNVLLDRSLIGHGQLSLQLAVDGVPANPVAVDIQ